MKRRSVVSGRRRNDASPRSCCARVALLLAFLCVWLPQPAAGEPAALQLPLPDGAEAAAVPDTPPATRPAASARPSDDLDSALGRRGDLNLHGLSLNAALFMISEQWNVNIVAGDVQGTVNGVFRDAPLREILDAILLSNGYNYRPVGQSLVVSSIAELGQINPFFQSATIQVQSADIDEVVEGARLLNTPQGQVRSLKSARSIVVLDFPDRVQMIRDFVAAVDGASGRGYMMADGRRGIALEVGHYRTQHIPARTAEHGLHAVLSKDGRVAVLEREDRLVVTDHAENLEMVERVLMRIDQPRPQVRITALIYDVSLQDIEQLGLNWNKIGHRAGDATTAIGIQPIAQVPLEFETSTTVAAIEGATVAFGAVTRHLDINGVILALQNARDARLLANPNVTVHENEEAVFKSVSEIPFQQLTQTGQGGQIGTTAFREAGIKLTVIPKIAADGTIRMWVSPEFSRLVSIESGQPLIDTRFAQTTLTVANCQTVVIGGLRQRQDIGDFNGIPYLKDVRGVGRLFRSRDVRVRESELVVFIRPEIIGPAEPLDRRETLIVDTVGCRLRQIPEAEGCPPCCRRLPPELRGIEYYGEPALENELIHVLPPPDDVELAPLSAAPITSAELQFGAAGRSDHVRTLVAEGTLRRLPAVERPHQSDSVHAKPPLRR